MTRFALMTITLFFASPALANFGDLDADLKHLTPEVTVVAQPLQAIGDELATTDLCRLPNENIVAIPPSFTVGDALGMACAAAE